tara:strand:+ start:116 stop:319 length:204 start_codon:yes stop_codon:yes gene_type:complete
MPNICENQLWFFSQFIKNCGKEQVRLSIHHKNIYHHEMHDAVFMLTANLALRQERLLRHFRIVSYLE